jgi:hypothetical protein
MPFEIDCKWVSYLKQFTLVDIILAWNLKKYNLKKTKSHFTFCTIQRHMHYLVYKTQKEVHTKQKNAIQKTTKMSNTDSSENRGLN